MRLPLEIKHDYDYDSHVWITGVCSCTWPCMLVHHVIPKDVYEGLAHAQGDGCMPMHLSLHACAIGHDQDFLWSSSHA